MIAVVDASVVIKRLLQDPERESPKLKVYSVDPLDGCGLLDDLRLDGAAAPDLQIGSRQHPRVGAGK